MQRTDISIRGFTCDTDGTINRRVRDIVKGWDLGVPPQRYEPYLKTGIELAAAGYGHTPVDVQVHIALYTLLGLCVDDFLVDMHALQEFSTRLNSGLPQLHPVLEYVVDILHRMSEFYLPYACKAIVISTIEFINMTLFEKEIEDMEICGDALRWVEYKRLRNGIGEAYAFFVWDKFSFPDITTHIQANPDVLSFYKEELVGEARNFIHDRAVATDTSASTALTDTVDEIVGAVKAARSILKGRKEKETLERWLVGFAAFHFQTARYRLKELTGSEFI
ncbi:hypothetical protein PHLCEN_2v6805 [Hermanssonia centrifuga]|uniref:Terpenoid synthase n=1 Tax=Hermanssonia centrifuga TaxID=98765 RepID=A0A2R6NYF5_9APHY|nr:hypothetical protein PHLCEN_2v6805 [Hermanssonia centrifuga]